MSHDGREFLIRLGAGEPIEALCAEAGWSRDEFDAWWRDTLDPESGHLCRFSTAAKPNAR